MKENDTEQWVRDYYLQQSLPDSKIAHILRNAPKKNRMLSFPSTPNSWLSYAAAACIAFMIVSVVITQVVNRVGMMSETELASGVLSIYDRHLDPDVYSPDLRSIEAGLFHSDFSIVPTNMGSLKNYQILGGRSCGYRGIKAVHIVLINKESKQEGFLYILPETRSLSACEDKWVEVGDQRVALWNDNGRIFALYDPSN